MKDIITHVGLDAHSETSHIVALNQEGVEILSVNVATNEKALKKQLRKLPGEVTVMLESSSMCVFVKKCIMNTVKNVIVCETRNNRWIANSDDKSDYKDAYRLARLLMFGEYKEVYTPTGLGFETRELSRAYQKAQWDVVRNKNRINDKVRRYGIQGVEDIYYDEGRRQVIDSIRGERLKAMMETYYLQLDANDSVSDSFLQQLMKVVKPMPEFKLLCSIPGIGKIRAAAFIAIIGDPFRFENKRALWSYSGLGLCKPWSADPSKGRVKGKKGYNRVMKHHILGAASTAIKGDNRFARHYEEMISRGVDPSMAKRTAARQITATILAILKSGKLYTDEP